MQPSSVALLFSPTSHVETLRSSYGLLLTWCASRELEPLFSLSPLLVVIPSEPSPILPVVPTPSFAAKPAILFGSVGLLSGMIQNRLTTQ